MNLTRESVLWWILLILGLITSLATLDTSTAIAFGIPAAALPYIRLIAFLTAAGSTWAKTSPFPSKNDPPSGSAGSVNLNKIAPLVLLAVLLGIGGVTGCAKAAPVLTPAPVISAVKATEIVHALDAFRDVAEALSIANPPVISRHAVNAVLTAHESLVKIIGASPNGWKPTGQAVLAQLVKDLGPDYPRLQPYVALVQTLVEAFVPAVQP